jgi:hypothetical protein
MSKLVYASAVGVKGNFMERIVIKIQSLRSIKRLANSMVETR